VFQIVDFCSGNDLKFTYVHLQFQKFFPGDISPDPHDKGEGGKGGDGMGKEGKEEEVREGRDGIG
jgi:hypothetical protein